MTWAGRAVAGGLALTLLLLWPWPADAQVLTLSLTSPSVGNFSSLTLNGSAQTTTASVGTFSVSDSRVTALGWHVTVSASQLCETSTPPTCVTLGKTLPLGSIDESRPSVSGPGTLPATSAVTGVDLTPATPASAAIGTGLGTYTFGATTLTVHVPASTYARTYVSTVTYAVITGP